MSGNAGLGFGSCALPDVIICYHLLRIWPGLARSRISVGKCRDLFGKKQARLDLKCAADVLKCVDASRAFRRWQILPFPANRAAVRDLGNLIIS